MPTCDKCNDPLEYEWFLDQMEHWRLGTKIDVNVFRPHVCKPVQRGPTKYWCFHCGAGIRFDRPCIHRRQQIKPEKKVGYF